MGDGGGQHSPTNVQDPARLPHRPLEITPIDGAHRRDKQVAERMIAQPFAVALAGLRLRLRRRSHRERALSVLAARRNCNRNHRLPDSFLRAYAVAKAVLEEFRHLRLGVGQGDEAVTNVAGRQDVELFLDLAR
jgi:hypothetical protein